MHLCLLPFCLLPPCLLPDYGMCTSVRLLPHLYLPLPSPPSSPAPLPPPPLPEYVILTGALQVIDRQTLTRCLQEAATAARAQGYPVQAPPSIQVNVCYLVHQLFHSFMPLGSANEALGSKLASIVAFRVS